MRGWCRPPRTARSPAEGTPDPLAPHESGATLLALLETEPLHDLVALDVGTGWGRLAFALAPRCRRVIGIDRDPAVIDDGRRRAAAAGVANVEFVVADAETLEYTAFGPDLVVARLCVSDSIVERAGRALASGHVLAFVAFHVDQWHETGRPSRFAYDEARMRRLLERTGFAVEHLEVARGVASFGSVGEGLAAAGALEEKWRADGRWLRYVQFLEQGGRTLTQSHLIVKARRT